MRKTILSLAFLLFSVPDFAQAPSNLPLSRFDGQVSPAGFPNPLASIAVCQSGGSGGPPCSPLALIWQDANGITQQINPFPTQANGRFTFFAPAGSYVLQTFGTGYSTTLTTITLASAVPASSGGTSFPVTSAVAVNSGGSITVNTGGSISPAGSGTITATAAPFTGLTGSASCAQLPALTGDATTSAGTCATTLATVTAPKGGTGVASPTVHALLAAEGASAMNVVCTPPATNGDYNVLYHITGAAAVDPTCPQIGLGGAAGLTGATNSYLVAFSDNGTVLTHDKAASGAINVTLNTATTLGNPNFAFRWSDHSAQGDTITPTTWTIQKNNAAAGASISVGSGETCLIKVDPNLATQWVADCSVIVPTSVNITGGTAGFLSKFSGGNLVPTLCDEAITTANTITCTDTAGIVAPKFVSSGTTAGFTDYPQGTTSAAVAPCNAATSICEQAPTAVTSYLVVKPGTGAQGVITNVVTAAVDTQGFSGDANHSTTVTTGSGTSIGSTSLCSTGNCPVGTYRVNAYIDITTACTTTGTYIVNLIYTDDQASKTVPINIQGTGTTPATGSLALNAVTNFGQASQILRSTGAASINYSTTATACGTGGPMVGKLYLSVEPVQ